MTWNARFVQLRGHYAFHATACTPGRPREKGSVEGAVRHHKTGFWPARRFGSLAELDAVYADWRDRVALPRRHATRPLHRRRALGGRARGAPRAAAGRFDAAGRRPSRVPLDGYLKHAGCFYRAPEALVHQRVELRFDRDRVWIGHRGQTSPATRAATSPAPGCRRRCGPRPRRSRRALLIALPAVAPPELAAYAELCA